MNEIKFRAWDNQNEYWYERDKFCMNGCGDIYVYVDNEWIDAPNDVVILMQYTGLKDKNGKEIYEGDICSVCGVVIFHHGSFGKKSQWSKGFTPFYEYNVIPTTDSGGIVNSKLTSEDFEVIGNIYENPELLN